MAKISKADLLKLQRQLGTDDAIGKKFGVTRQAIHQLRQKYGIASLRAGNPARNKGIAALYGKGNTGAQIAKKMDLSISQTYRIIRDMGGKKKRKKR